MKKKARKEREKRGGKVACRRASAILYANQGGMKRDPWKGGREDLLEDGRRRRLLREKFVPFKISICKFLPAKIPFLFPVFLQFPSFVFRLDKREITNQIRRIAFNHAWSSMDKYDNSRMTRMTERWREKDKWYNKCDESIQIYEYI